jgi:hypothetical protein
MATNDEQTTATTPLEDDPAAFNIVEATFHPLYATHPELHAMVTELIKPLGYHHLVSQGGRCRMPTLQVLPLH